MGVGNSGQEWGAETAPPTPEQEVQPLAEKPLASRDVQKCVGRRGGGRWEEAWQVSKPC